MTISHLIILGIFILFGGMGMSAVQAAIAKMARHFSNEIQRVSRAAESKPGISLPVRGSRGFPANPAVRKLAWK